MPSGLPEVVQPVGADTSRYIAAYRAAREEVRGLIGDNKELLAVIAQVQGAPRGAAPGGDIASTNAAIRETLATLREVQPAMAAATAATGGSSAAVRDLGSAHLNLGPLIRATTAAVADQASVMREQVTVVQAAADAATGHATSLGVQQERVAAVSQAMRDWMQNAEAVRVKNEALSGSADTASDSLVQQAVNLGALRDTARDTTSALADTAAAASALRGGAPGPATVSILGPALAAAVTQAAGQPSPWAAPTGAVAAQIAANVARNAGGGGGGGGGGGDPFYAFTYGPGGPGGGSGNDIGAFLSRAGQPGSAGYDANAIVGFVKRWWTAAHWTMMATNEILATVGPAAAAAGAAALVGLQGGQQLVNRYQAITTTAEALGGAYGQTAGSFMGAGSQLQNYQNLAGGGVYEIAGAGINILKSGAGNQFGQMGLNTIAMIDRGIADMQINMGKNGTAAALGKLTGSGTGYLQQFGDIGANLGNLFLGLAPNLPGVGGDYISALEGVTGALSGGVGFLNRSGNGDILGALLAGEAGIRVGKPLVGLAGKGLQGLGALAGKVPGLGGEGFTASDIAAIADITGEDLGAGAIGLGGSGLAGMLAGAGTGLTALAGPEIGLAAAAAYLISKIGPPASVAKVGALQAGINQAGFTGAWQPLGKAITTATGLSAPPPGSGLSTYGAALSSYGAGQTGLTEGRFGTIGQTNQQVYASAATSFATQMGDLAASGPQLQAALQKAGLKSVSMADAFQIAQNSLLDLSHAFDSHGNLNKQAQQMLSNYVSAIGPMTKNAGAFGAAIGGQTVMSSEPMQDLAKVNQAMDSMTQIMSGGPAGMAALFGMIGGAHPAGKTPASMASMAKALTSFTTAGGASAWTTFASTSQPSVISSEQANLDQLRTALTLNAISAPGAAGLAGFQLQQLLPMAKKSPAALAMLMQQGAQMGVTGYYNQGQSQAQNYAAAVAATAQIADNSKQANAAMNSMTIGLANIPALAKQFSQSLNAGVAAQQLADSATQIENIKKAMASGGSTQGAVSALVGDVKAAGVSGTGNIKTVIDSALKQAGLTQGQIAKVNVQITAQVTGTAQVRTLQDMLNALHDKHVTASAYADAHPVQVLDAAMAGLTNKTVTLTTNVVTNYINTVHTQLGVPTSVAAGVSPGFLLSHGQTGLKIPGYGGGDIWPAMLEPGELVVPKHMVAAGMVNHLRGSIPGFAGGGVIGGSAINLGLEQVLMNQVPGAQLPIPAIAQQVLDTLLAELSKAGAWKQAGVNIVNGITYSLSGPADAAKVGKQLVSETAKAASNLASQIQTEFNYARGVAAATVAGQGYGTQGLISGFTATPGPSGAGAAPPGAPGYNAAAWNAATANAASDTAPAQTVQQQMQSYLSSVKAFTKDLATLHKDHLSKAIISQLEAAGPVQGDALAQSILTGGGGVKGANALWNQIGQASKGLGAQAAMDMYGGTIAPNLKSGTISVGGITINVSVPGGATGNLPLTQAQIKILTEEIQAALLKQARRNNRTGVQQSGKGA